MSTVTIDLGLLDDGWDAAEEGPVGLPRGWALLGVLLLLLVSLVTAGPLPAPPAEVTRQPLRNGEFHLLGSTLFVLDSDRTPTPVEAYDTAGGGLRWTYLPEGQANLSYVEMHGELAVFSPDLCRTGITGTTVAVDRRTGRERWRATGVPVRTPAAGEGTLVMRSLWSDGCRALADNTYTAGVLRWQFIDGAGELRWDTAVEAGTRFAVDAGPGGATWVAVVDRDGNVSTVDLRTGVRSAPAALAGLGTARFTVVDGLLLVGGGGRLKAYTRDLTPVWVASGVDDGAAVVPCGSAVCVTGLRTVALDPADGSTRWTAPGGAVLAQGARRVLPADVGLALPAGWRVLAVDGPRTLLGLSTDGDTVLAWSGPRPTPFATLPELFMSCEADTSLLACATEHDEVVLLRL